MDAELLPGGGGIFDVTVDGRLIYSKAAEEERFPEPDEVSRRIRAVTD